MLTGYVKLGLRWLIKLHKGVFTPLLHMPTGVLPAEAALHTRQFSLLHMVASIPATYLLRLLAKHVLVAGVRFS